LFDEEKQMNSMSKGVVAVVLCVSLTGCNPRWLERALADLPVLTQMALNIATLVSAFSGQQTSTAESAAIRNISAEAARDLNLLDTLYREYQASPSQNSLQKIQGVISDMNRNLLALLQAAHISDVAMATRMSAAVNLILTTVNSFGALMPQARMPHTRLAPVPQARELKRQWNQQVCANSILAGCEVR
jgi:hypothetical protein